MFKRDYPKRHGGIGDINRQTDRKRKGKGRKERREGGKEKERKEKLSEERDKEYLSQRPLPVCEHTLTKTPPPQEHVSWHNSACQ